MCEKSNALKTIGLNDRGGFYCFKTKQAIDREIEEYSRFKFGDVDAIHSLSSAAAGFFIKQLEVGDGLRKVFDKAKNDGEFVYLQAPGIRNLASSSNYLMAEVASKVNVWLALNGYPTMIKKPVVRLASGIPNYAELSSETRRKRVKTTVSLMPTSDYAAYPINVIFIDDVEVTGCTRERAELNSLSGGAASFNAIFAYRVENTYAKQDASIENKMNHYFIKGNLDDAVSRILSHPDYQPVQRMLRLLLNSKNREAWSDFARVEIPDRNLLRIYSAALSNDYHSISSEGEFLYAASLNILSGVLKEKELIDASGMLKSRI